MYVDKTKSLEKVLAAALKAANKGDTQTAAKLIKEALHTKKEGKSCVCMPCSLKAVFGGMPSGELIPMVNALSPFSGSAEIEANTGLHRVLQIIVIKLLLERDIPLNEVTDAHKEESLHLVRWGIMYELGCRVVSVEDAGMPNDTKDNVDTFRALIDLTNVVSAFATQPDTCEKHTFHA